MSAALHTSIIHKRGIALVLTLLVLTILIILVVQLRLTTRLHVIQSANMCGDIRNAAGARAALEFARLYIQTDSELAPEIDTLHEPWARPISIPDLPGASVQLFIEDEERRFNLYRLVRPDGKPDLIGIEQLARLTAVLGIPDASLAARIADYIDPDSEGEFESGAKNRMLIMPEELAMMPGVYPEFLYGGFNPKTNMPFRGLLEYVTLWPFSKLGSVPIEVNPVPNAADAAEGGQPPAPGDATPKPPVVAIRRSCVNLNTVLPEVLLALSPEMTPEIARAVESYRLGMEDNGTPRVIKSLTDLLRIPGMTGKMVDSLKNEVVLKSSVFSARVVSTSGNVTRRVRYVLGRGVGDIVPPLLTWWEEGGAFGMQRPGDNTE